MKEIRADLGGIYNYLDTVFNYFYFESGESQQNDSVFDDIIDSVEYALENVIWLISREGEILKYKIGKILENWRRNRDDLRSRGAGMNREAILVMKKEVLEVIEDA